MTVSLPTKLQHIVARHQELASLLADQASFNNQDLMRSLTKEYASLTPIVECITKQENLVNDSHELQELLNTADYELKDLINAELLVLTEQIKQAQLELQVLLIPPDPYDDHNIFLEIRAGTGGDEASLFAGDLCRMYLRYAELKSWDTEIIHQSMNEYGGYKEVIVRCAGKQVYSWFKFESGVHRVQRVPHTEAQGRIHTSTCTVAVLPELDEISSVDINPADLRIDTFRASGAGGQHVNKTDSAIRITHLPTGVVVECQDERSQHKNRARALALLHTKILTQRQNEQKKQQEVNRRNLVGTGDRSERIRTYNFPQGRVTDHRINLTLYKLQAVLDGDVDLLINVLRQEHQADLLANVDMVDQCKYGL